MGKASINWLTEGDRLRGSTPINALTVDVEDYFQVSAFQGIFHRSEWHKLQCRIPRNIERLLALLSDHEVSATFFVLGWVAERYPNLVRQIADAGHEIASHGYEHIRVSQQTPREFHEDVSRAKQLLEDTSGLRVRGYRAASFSIDRDRLWTLQVLRDTGHEYSSSVYPVHHDHYGIPDAPRFPFRLEPDGLLEIPMATARLFGRNFPCAGGGYFRLYPLALSTWALRRLNEKEQMPGVFYFHPWELDPEQPRVSNAKITARFRHYVNLRRFEARLRSMLKSFRWDRMDRVFLESP